MPIVSNPVDPFRTLAVSEVYADAGIVVCNPSRFGASWSFLWVSYPDTQQHKDSHLGSVLVEQSAYYEPEEVGMPQVTSNLAEIIAILCAVERLPDNWSGRVHSD